MQDNEPDGNNSSTSEFRQTITATDNSTSDAAPLHDLTSFQRDILRILADDGRVGLRLMEVLNDCWESEITHGRLYPNLDTLINKGLVTKEKLDGRTNEYKITTRGRREFCAHRNWMTRPLDGEARAISEDVDVIRKRSAGKHNGNGGRSE